MTYKNGLSSSDSVNLGSNPSSPATRKARASSLSEFISYLENLDKAEQIADAGRTNVGTGVYVIRAGAHVRKIGFSSRVERRLSGLQGSTPYPLSLEYFEPFGEQSREIERAAHRLLSGWRVGGEWFRLPLNVALLAIDGARDHCPRVRDFFRFHNEARKARHCHKQRQIVNFVHDRYPDLWSRIYGEDDEDAPKDAFAICEQFRSLLIKVGIEAR